MDVGAPALGLAPVVSVLVEYRVAVGNHRKIAQLMKIEATLAEIRLFLISWSECATVA